MNLVESIHHSRAPLHEMILMWRTVHTDTQCCPTSVCHVAVSIADYATICVCLMFPVPCTLLYLSMCTFGCPMPVQQLVIQLLTPWQCLHAISVRIIPSFTHDTYLIVYRHSSGLWSHLISWQSQHCVSLDPVRNQLDRKLLLFVPVLLLMVKVAGVHGGMLCVSGLHLLVHWEWLHVYCML